MSHHSARQTTRRGSNLEIQLQTVLHFSVGNLQICCPTSAKLTNMLTYAEPYTSLCHMRILQQKDVGKEDSSSSPRSLSKSTVLWVQVSLKSRVCRRRIKEPPAQLDVLQKLNLQSPETSSQSDFQEPALPNGYLYNSSLRTLSLSFSIWKRR